VPAAPQQAAAAAPELELAAAGAEAAAARGGESAAEVAAEAAVPAGYGPRSAGSLPADRRVTAGSLASARRFLPGRAIVIVSTFTSSWPSPTSIDLANDVLRVSC